MKQCKFLLVSFLIGLLILPSAVSAEPGHGKGKHKPNFDRQEDASSINKNDRAIIQTYLQQAYVTKCPPGLAKKNTACLPPGQVKKYKVGDVLANYGPVPQVLAALLTPLPSGYRYAMADDTVYLIAEASRRIIDAVSTTYN